MALPGASILRSIVSALASFYRLGQRGKARPGTEAPARPQLRSVEEIVDTLKAARQLPPPAEGSRLVWTYACNWIDTETGARIGGGAVWTVETGPDGTYQQASSMARRLMLSPNPNALSPPAPTGPNVKLQCTRIGNPFTLPTQPE